jgi:hypothetical protein
VSFFFIHFSKTISFFVHDRGGNLKDLLDFYDTLEMPEDGDEDEIFREYAFQISEVSEHFFSPPLCDKCTKIDFLLYCFKLRECHDFFCEKKKREFFHESSVGRSQQIFFYKKGNDWSS